MSEEWYKSTVSENWHGHLDPAWLVGAINNNAEGIELLFKKIDEMNERLKRLEASRER